VGQLVAGEGEPERGVDARAVEEVQQLLTGSRPSSRNPVPLGEIVSTPAEPLWAAERSRSFLERARRRCRCHCGGTLTGYPSGVHFLGRFGDEVTPAETTATRYAGERR
jgi:hypothetical protein